VFLTYFNKNQHLYPSLLFETKKQQPARSATALQAGKSWGWANALSRPLTFAIPSPDGYCHPQTPGCF